MPSRTSQRIVSLAPNVTSILLALGARRELVGVSKWCKDVADVGSRPRVGDCWKLDVCEVMRLKPSLVIGSVPFAPKTVSEILKQPVAFLGINPRSLAGIEGDILTLGALVNRSAVARKLIARMRRAFDEVRRKARHIEAHPRVYAESWPNPRISSPPWVSELIEIGGGRPVVSSGARVSDEDVARGLPDVIILAWAATGDRAKPSRAFDNPAWKDVPAIRNRRVVVIRDELLNTPGPPLMQGARELFCAIHGRV